MTYDKPLSVMQSITIMSNLVADSLTSLRRHNESTSGSRTSIQTSHSSSAISITGVDKSEIVTTLTFVLDRFVVPRLPAHVRLNGRPYLVSTRTIKPAHRHSATTKEPTVMFVLAKCPISLVGNAAQVKDEVIPLHDVDREGWKGWTLETRSSGSWQLQATYSVVDIGDEVSYQVCMSLVEERLRQQHRFQEEIDREVHEAIERLTSADSELIVLLANGNEERGREAARCIEVKERRLQRQVADVQESHWRLSCGRGLSDLLAHRFRYTTALLEREDNKQEVTITTGLLVDPSKRRKVTVSLVRSEGRGWCMPVSAKEWRTRVENILFSFEVLFVPDRTEIEAGEQFRVEARR